MPGNSKFTLEIENNVLKNLHFKAFKKTQVRLSENS